MSDERRATFSPFFHFVLAYYQAFVCFSCQADLLGGQWDCLDSDLLDNLKAQLNGSVSDDCIVLHTMKNLRLVNLHWSLWATGATTMLSITGHHIPPVGIVEILAENFGNLTSLHLCKRDLATGNGLRSLVEFPSLTHLNLCNDRWCCALRITDVGMS